MDRETNSAFLRSLRDRNPKEYRTCLNAARIGVLEAWFRRTPDVLLENWASQRFLLINLNERFFLDYIQLHEQLNVSIEAMEELNEHMLSLFEGGTVPDEVSKDKLKAWCAIAIFLSSLGVFPIGVFRRGDVIPNLYDVILGLSANATFEDLKRAWTHVTRMREEMETQPRKAHANFGRDVRWYYLRLKGKPFREIGEMWASENPRDFKADLRNYKKKTEEELSRKEFLRSMYPRTISAALKRFENKIVAAYP